jgi:GNAT superfamily N-acetyltransferase
VTQDTAIEITQFSRRHLAGLVELCAVQGWDIYAADPERTYRALTGPGSTTLIALEGGEVIGFIQVQSDGVIQAHLSALLVAAGRRRGGTGRRLLSEGLDRAGGEQIDIRTQTEGYYEGLGASRSLGYRLLRSDLGL